MNPKIIRKCGDIRCGNRGVGTWHLAQCGSKEGSMSSHLKFCVTGFDVFFHKSRSSFVTTVNVVPAG